MNKVAGLAAALAVLLAIVAAIVPIPGIDVMTVLFVLGVVGGVCAAQDGAVRVYVAVLAFPAVGAAAASVPAVGEYLNAMALNFAAAAAGIAASLMARRLYDMTKGGITGMIG